MINSKRMCVCKTTVKLENIIKDNGERSAGKWGKCSNCGTVIHLKLKENGKGKETYLLPGNSNIPAVFLI